MQQVLCKSFEALLKDLHVTCGIVFPNENENKMNF